MPKKILLADDSITIQKVVELTFSDGDYEVTAVNNGAKAIQKLSEMRPDIILSDIIMPEKNGYEVCEFVKSHPEYRNIPVVLLTGTFEPFDPDRADKAGCDAVVTKPFESQSLIHKVEELIEDAKVTAPTEKTPAITAAPPAPAPTPAPAPAPAPEPSPWLEEPAAPATPMAAAPPPAATAPPVHETDIFGAPPSAESFSGETRAFPKMNFDEMPKDIPVQEMPAPSAPSPWDEQPPLGAGVETRAFPPMPPVESVPESPFGAPPSEEAFSGETRAFPKMSFDQVPPPPSGAPPAKEEPRMDERPSSPWDEQPAFGGETKAFPKMSFEDLAKQAEDTPEAPAPWESASSAPPPPAWSMPEPAAPSTPATEPEAPAWAAPAAAPAAAAPSPAAAQPATGNGVDLTEEQVDRIARRVVQLMSDQVVRNIAWEVIPDLAEMVVKERIRQLETE